MFKYEVFGILHGYSWYYFLGWLNTILCKFSGVNMKFLPFFSKIISFGLQEVNGVKVLQLETAAGAAIKV